MPALALDGGLLTSCDPRREDALEHKRALARTLGGRTLAQALPVVVHLGIPLWALATSRAPAARRLLEAALDGSLVATASLAVDEEVQLVRREEDLSLRGTLPCVPSAADAALIVVVGRDLERGGCSLLAVPSATAGVTVEPRYASGAEPVAQVTFDACVLPTAAILADTDPSAASFRRVLFEARLLLWEAVLGVVEAALDETLAFAIARKLGGTTLADRQAVRHRFADLVARRDMASAFVEEAFAELRSPPVEIVTLDAMVALTAWDLAHEVLDGCVQLMGGRGFVTDTPVTRAYRDVLALRPLAAVKPVWQDIVLKGGEA